MYKKVATHSRTAGNGKSRGGFVSESLDSKRSSPAGSKSRTPTGQRTPQKSPEVVLIESMINDLEIGMVANPVDKTCFCMGELSVLPIQTQLNRSRQLRSMEYLGTLQFVPIVALCFVNFTFLQHLVHSANPQSSPLMNDPVLSPVCSQRKRTSYGRKKRPAKLSVRSFCDCRRSPRAAVRFQLCRIPDRVQLRSERKQLRQRFYRLEVADTQPCRP